jgi:nucleotide-binding universal stress UspA family protein
MLDKIVVGYAGDTAGRDALALAADLATATGGKLTVVFPYRPLFTRETCEEVQAHVEAEVAPQIGGISPSYRWSPSSWPIRALHELAEYEEADLIVLGAAKQDIGDRLHVSLMERMVHGAPCAVAVAPADYAQDVADSTGPAEGSALTPHALRKIGVGFASSAEGRAAVGLARELAGLSGGGVKVIAGAGLEPALASYSFSSPALGEVEQEMYEEIEQTLTRVCGELETEGGPTIEHETIRGDPASILVKRSEDLDLLVLGSRAYGPLRHVLLGSVSAHAMREAKCPVLVVPRGVAGEDGHAQPRSAGVAQA